MTPRGSPKPYWEMTAEELAEATREFDAEFVADKAKSLTPEMQTRWARAKAKRVPAKNTEHDQTIAVHLEKKLLDRCTRLARKKRITRDCLISRALRAVLAAEGEGE